MKNVIKLIVLTNILVFLTGCGGESSEDKRSKFEKQRQVEIQALKDKKIVLLTQIQNQHEGSIYKQFDETFKDDDTTLEIQRRFLPNQIYITEAMLSDIKQDGNTIIATFINKTKGLFKQRIVQFKLEVNNALVEKLLKLNRPKGIDKIMFGTLSSFGKGSAIVFSLKDINGYQNNKITGDFDGIDVTTSEVILYNILINGKLIDVVDFSK